MAKNEFKIQQNIRNSCNDLNENLKDLQNWEKTIKEKEKEKKQCQNEEISVPVRSKLIQNSDETKFEINQNEEISEITPQMSADKFKEKGNTCVKSQDYVKGAEFYTNAIDLYDADPAFYTNRALCFLKLQRFDECIADCSKAIELKPELSKSYYRRMLAYESLEKNFAALEDCKKVMELEPNKSIYMKNLQQLNKKIELDNKYILNKKWWTQFPADVKDTDFIHKSPHLRSKKSLKKLEITEIASKPRPKVKPVVVNGEDVATIPDAVVDKLFNNSTGEFNPHESSKRNFSRNMQPCSSKAIPLEAKPVMKKSQSLNIKEVTDTTPNYNLPFPPPPMEFPSTELNTNFTQIKKSKSEENVKAIPEVLDTFKVPSYSSSSGAQFFSTWKDFTTEQKYLFLKSLSDKDMERVMGQYLEIPDLSIIIQILSKMYIKNGDRVDNILKRIISNDGIGILFMLMGNDEKTQLSELCKYMRETNVAKDVVEHIELVFGLRI